MTYKLKFLPSARKDWDKLDNSIKQPLIKALNKRLDNPIVPKDSYIVRMAKNAIK